MLNRSPHRFGSERWFALMLVLAFLILLLLLMVGLIASYLPADPDSLQPHEYGFCLPLLGGLVFSVYLLRTARDELRLPLPLAMIVGLVLGLFLGILSTLPYHMGLLLAFGMLGPFLMLVPAGAQGFSNTYWLLDFWLSTGAVLLSLSLYALLAFLITRQTGSAQQGWWAAFLAAFISVVVATFIFVIIALVQSVPSFSHDPLTALIWVQYLPVQASPLGLGQGLHAGIGGLIGSAMARRHLLKRGGNEANR